VGLPLLVAVAGCFGQPAGMSGLSDLLQLRVRYSETDQMGTFYNSRALEWFECARTELMRRRLGMSYTALEARGVFLPLVEAHLEFLGPARYDASGKPVVRGYTVHAFTDRQGKPIRPPVWFIDMLTKAFSCPSEAESDTTAPSEEPQRL
jgi:acyl-CoA thioester hydrolase